jgi:hypothetical protein
MATPQQYLAERLEMDGFPHEGFVKTAFEFAGFDFGRIDFGIVGGEPQIYEINSNPYMQFNLQHDNPDRMETMEIMETRLVESLADLTKHLPLGFVSLKGCFKQSKSILRGPFRQ